ncbi:hypothetical protein LJR230_002282 [Trinickia sp. LjRoot230]|uniref:hypothetical protein n=1 Tax=Trinickia sp. LjRoot230 TaxID=3342288 RepID=UPI003ECCB7F3
MQTSQLCALPASAILKRAPLLIGGAIVSFIIAAVVQPARGGDPRANLPTQVRSQAAVRAPQPTPVVAIPRGDLRSDIVRNTYTRPEPSKAPPGPRPRNSRSER